MQSLMHACIFCTSNPRGQKTFFASYVLEGNTFSPGSIFFIIFSNFSNPLSEVPFSAFHCSNSPGGGGGLPGGQTPPRRGQTLARAWVASGPTRAPPTLPLRLFILHFGKTLDTREKFHGKFRSCRHR